MMHCHAFTSGEASEPHCWRLRDRAMAESPARERLTAAMLREEGWRLLDQARATVDPRIRRQLSVQALDLAQVAEMMDAEQQRKVKRAIIPAPRRVRKHRAMTGGTVPPEQ